METESERASERQNEIEAEIYLKHSSKWKPHTNTRCDACGAAAGQLTTYSTSVFQCHSIHSMRINGIAHGKTETHFITFRKSNEEEFHWKCAGTRMHSGKSAFVANSYNQFYSRLFHIILKWLLFLMFSTLFSEPFYLFKWAKWV